MMHSDIGMRLTVILAKPRNEIEDAEVEAIMRDVMRPLDVGTTGAIATLAGTNACDRQSLKRKASRWGATFAQLPPLERLLILRSITDAALQNAD